MRIVAVVPMKLNNRRLPGKNIKCFTNGESLCRYVLVTLGNISEIDEVYVYCSNPEIQEYLPSKVKFLKRSETLDLDTSTMNDVLCSFANEVSADIYVMSHATSPFITSESIKIGLDRVIKGENDSSFAAEKIQDFLWQNGSPFNYKLDYIPRTQDLDPIYKETSGFYIYTNDVIKKFHRRIGNNPYIVDVGVIEGIDIDEMEDFALADAVFNYRKMICNI